MNFIAAVKAVSEGFGKAWQYRWPFLIVFVMVRLLVLAIVFPVANLILSVAIATREQSALTDQDIALFLLTPVGFMASVAVMCLLLTGAVLGYALMSNILRSDQGSAEFAFRNSLPFVASRLVPLLNFSAQLIFRILLIAVPFLALALVVAAVSLTQYDINYYLTHWPPTFIVAAALIAVIVLAMIILLVRKLSGWAIALHLVLFEDTAPGKAFAESVTALSGHKARLTATIVVWVITRVLLGMVVAAIIGLLFNILPGTLATDLNGIAAVTVSLLLLWVIANTVIAVLADGALANVLYQTWRVASPTAAAAFAEAEPVEGETAPAPIPSLVFVAVALAALVFGTLATGRLLDAVASEQTVEIIAHRGAAGSFPENTMAAINGAIDEQADWVEIDVQETADGEVIVAHDSDFMKLGQVDLKVWDATMPELADIDIGSWFDATYSGERTPTLRDALAAVKDRGKMVIELKYYGHDVDLESRVVEIVEDMDMTDDVAIMSLKIDGVRKTQARRPDWRYGILAATAIGNLANLDADFLAVNTGQASLQLIRRAHKQGKELYVWTVDDPLTMSRMISMGVDGLITNEPALARQVMNQRNDLSTYERLALWLTDRFRIGNFKLVADERDS